MNHFRIRSVSALALILLLISCSESTRVNNESESAIRAVLTRQVTAWNKGDLEEFMAGYWKSDSILFIGSKITHGWTETLARYKKSYPDKAAMGILEFTILKTDALSSDCYLVTGRYLLNREHDTPTGIFTLVFRKKEGRWLIVYDHTS